MVLSTLPTERELFFRVRPIILQMTGAELATVGTHSGHQLSAVGYRPEGKEGEEGKASESDL